MKNLLITCDNEQEFMAVVKKFGGTDRDFEWSEYNNTINVDDGEAEGFCDSEFYNKISVYKDYERTTAKKILNIKPKKTMSKKTYKTKVEVEKIIKFSLPKYELNKPITVDMAEKQGKDKPERWTISPFHSYWNYDRNEEKYFFYRWDGKVSEIFESYINKHLIKE